VKYFIVADVHGFYNEMVRALVKEGFDKNNPNHTFVSLGDLLDRGEQPKECLEFVNNLERKILIIGNHELLMDEMAERGYPKDYDFKNGTFNTARIITNAKPDEICSSMKDNELYQTYRKECKFYHEVGDHIFVHGWIPCIYAGKYSITPVAYKKDWRDAPLVEWIDSTWINGMLAWAAKIREPGKTIWCGHWHTSYGHANLHNYGVEFPHEKGEEAHFSPFIDEGIVAMDACTAYSKKVNCKVIEI